MPVHMFPWGRHCGLFWGGSPCTGSCSRGCSLGHILICADNEMLKYVLICDVAAKQLRIAARHNAPRMACRAQTRRPMNHAMARHGSRAAAALLLESLCH